MVLRTKKTDPKRPEMPNPHPDILRHKAALEAGLTHCQLCGSTDYENLNTGDQGYTACCNEPAVESSYCQDCDQARKIQGTTWQTSPRKIPFSRRSSPRKEITDAQAERYVLLYEWAEQRALDLDSDVFLGEGYGPLDRWRRLEHVYAKWIANHPNDAFERPDSS